MGSKKKVTIGYKYYMGMDMKICHGPVDQVGPVYAGERLISGVLATYDPLVDDSIQQVFADSPDLFGGEKKEGGIQGNIDIMFGADDQVQNDYLLGQDGMDATNVPGFRGIVSLILRKIYIAAMSPYPKPWAVSITRIPQRNWYPETAVIKQVGDEFDGANGAHMTVDTLTNPDWGLGYSFGRIDEASFRAVADTLFAEGFSLSMLLSQQDAVDKFLQEIMKHVNGVVYTDRVTGAFVFKLYRGDYDVETLQTFDENNIVKLNSYQRPAYGEMVNEIVLVYRVRGELTDSVQTFQDLSSIQAQGGIISQTLQYPGIDSDVIASQVGVRELRQNSTPLAQVKITVNRQGNTLNPGDVFRFSWGPLGVLSTVLRVLKVDYGDLQSTRITIDAVEDLFSLGASSYTDPQPPLWTDPVGDPVPTAANLFMETPYLDIAFFFADDTGYMEALTDSDAFVTYLAKEPSAKGPGFELWGKLSAQVDYAFRASGVYAAVPTLNAFISEYDEVVPVQNLDSFDTADFDIGDYGILGQEIVRIDNIDYITQEITLGRGCLDTTPEKHALNDRLWLGQNEWAFDDQPFVKGVTVDAKALTQTGSGILDIDAIGIEVQSLVLTGRQYLPYPPANVKFIYYSGVERAFPDFVYNNTPAARIGSEMTFENRNRISQTVPGLIFDFFDPNISPEPDTSYDVRYFSETKLEALDNLADQTYSFASAPVNSVEWPTEAADTPTLYEVNLVPGDILNMPFYNSSIGGTLSLEAQAQNVVNTDFSQGQATMTDGTFDIGNFAVPGSIVFAFSFIASGEGEDIQTLISKSDVTGLIEYGVYYDNVTKRVVIGRNTDSVNQPASAYPIEPGVSYAIMISQLGLVATVYVNGTLGIVNTGWSAIPPGGKSWTVGGRYTLASPSAKVNLFTGIMKDLRFYPGPIDLADYRSPNLRISKVFRVKATTVRTEGGDTYDSMQSYDYNVKRIGWGIGWGNNWTGRP